MRYRLRLGDWFIASAAVAWFAAYFSLEFAESESLLNWALLALVYSVLAVVLVRRLRHHPSTTS